MERLTREPTQAERQVFDRLLAIPFHGRCAVARQLAAARVRTIDADGGLALDVPRDVAAAPVARRIPVEACFEDADGELASVLLHIQNDGYVNELELFRYDGKRVQVFPRADDLEVRAFGDNVETVRVLTRPGRPPLP